MSRKGKRLVMMMVSITGTFVLSVLQLQAQVLMFPPEFMEQVDGAEGRRMEEIQPPPRYLALGFDYRHDVALKGYAFQVARQLGAQMVPVNVRSQTFAAACAQSLLDTKGEFDYVTVEYSIFDDAVNVLVDRLRLRFPRAAIVLVEATAPDGKDPAGLRGVATPSWTRSKTLHSERDSLTVVPVQPFLSQRDSNGKFLDPKYSTRFAETIVEKMAEAPTQLSPIHKGTWGSGDSCNIWFTHDSDHPVSLAGRSVDIAYHDGVHKHAIEFGEKQGEHIIVHNPFFEERLLFLSYVTSVEDNVYPKSTVKLNGVPSVQLDPFHDEETVVGRDVVRTSAVGIIPAGQTTVQILPVRRARYNFRLVGASIIASEMVGVPIDFTLEAESLENTNTQRTAPFQRWIGLAHPSAS